MMKDEIVRNLRSCSVVGTCKECPFIYEEDCENKLMSAAADLIESYGQGFEVSAEKINKLMLDKETLEEMLEEKYTKAQLVQAVNDIFDDTETKDLNSTAQSVCAFLRLIDADGYMAVLPDGTVEIRLNEE